MEKPIIETFQQYFDQFPTEVQQRMQQIVQIAYEVMPNAKEKISYAMPTFTLKGKNMVHFAAFQKHIGFYPGPATIAYFEDQLQTYKHAKGSVQFPLNKPLPSKLIKQMIEHRITLI